ncbi:MAG: hypothetical protein LBL20_01730 [Treponema sp.]|nr:hypothetical protein [Treponema sp.]
MGTTFDLENDTTSPWIYEGDHGSRVRVAYTRRKGDLYSEIDAAAKTGGDWNTGNWAFAGGGINVNYWNPQANDWGGLVGIALKFNKEGGITLDSTAKSAIFQKYFDGRIFIEIGFGDYSGGAWWVPIPIDKNYDEDSLFRIQFRFLRNLNFGLAYYHAVSMPYWFGEVPARDEDYNIIYQWDSVAGDWVYEKDTDGNIKLDADGKPVKVPVMVKNLDNAPHMGPHFWKPLVFGLRFSGNPISFGFAVKAGDVKEADPWKNQGTRVIVGAEWRIIPELTLRANAEGRSLDEFSGKGVVDAGQNLEFNNRLVLAGLTVKEISVYRGDNAPLNSNGTKVNHRELLLRPYFRYRILDKAFARLTLNYTKGLAPANKDLSNLEIIPAFFYTLKGRASDDIDSMDTGFLVAYSWGMGTDAAGKHALKNELCIAFKVRY